MSDVLECEVVIEKVENMLWQPVRVKPRQEKKLVEYCKAKKVVSYLPLMKRVHRYERKTAEFFVPMFPGYVFCLLDEERYSEIVRSNAILFRIDLTEGQEETLIHELKELQDFERIVKGKEVVLKPEIVEGVKVVMASGPMKGVQGVVARREGQTFIYVNIDILGQSVATKIDIGDIDIDD